MEPRPYPNQQPESGYGPPPNYPASSHAPAVYGQDLPKAAGPARARTLLIVLAAAVVELLYVAGYNNQYFAGKVRNHIHGVSLRDLLAGSSLTYEWRFKPRGGSDFGHLWLAQLMFVVAFLVVSLALIWVLARGAVTFWRVWVGVVGVVLLATVVAAFVRGAIFSPGVLGGAGVAEGKPGRATDILFLNGLSTATVLAALGLGLLTGLVAAIVAVTTRRPVAAVAPSAPGEAPYSPPEQPPPFHAEDPGPRQDPDQTYAFARPDVAPEWTPSPTPPPAPAPSPTPASSPAPPPVGPSVPVDDEPQWGAASQTRQFPTPYAGAAPADPASEQTGAAPADEHAPTQAFRLPDAPVSDDRPAPAPSPSFEPAPSFDPAPPEPAPQPEVAPAYEPPASFDPTPQPEPAYEPAPAEPVDEPDVTPEPPPAATEPAAPEPPSAPPASPAPGTSTAYQPGQPGPETTRFADPPERQ